MEESERIYYSDFNVTVNTQLTGNDELRRALIDAVSAMDDPAVVQDEILDYVVVRQSSASSYRGVEVGPRRRLMHMHFVWELIHSTPTLSIGPRNDPSHEGINRRLQRYFNERLGIANSYVHASLMRPRSAAKNYNRKGQAALAAAPGAQLADRVVLARGPMAGARP